MILLMLGIAGFIIVVLWVLTTTVSFASWLLHQYKGFKREYNKHTPRN